MFLKHKKYRYLLQNMVSFIGLFAKETYNFKEPTNHSHPIPPEEALHRAVFCRISSFL